MDNPMTIYTCAGCGTTIGFVEHFSHDHPNFDAPGESIIVRTKYCTACAQERNRIEAGEVKR